MNTTVRPEPFVCGTCGFTRDPLYLEISYGWHTLSRCPVCDERERTAKNRAAVQASVDFELARIDKILLRCGVSPRHVNAKLTDFGSAYQALHAGAQGLYVYGPCGTGKTHLVAGMMRQIILNHLRIALENETMPQQSAYPIMVSTTTLLLNIRATFRDYGLGSESSIIDQHATRPILVLDDLGAEKATDWALTTLGMIIDQRYRAGLKTLITSNLSLKELASRIVGRDADSLDEYTSDRMASRIAEMCRVIRLGGLDRRMNRDL